MKTFTFLGELFLQWLLLFTHIRTHTQIYYLDLLSFIYTPTTAKKKAKLNLLLSSNGTWRHMWHVQTVAGGRRWALCFCSFFLWREGWVESFCTQLHCRKFVGWLLSCCIDPPCHLELVYWHIESGPHNLVPLNYDIHMMSRCPSSIAVYFTCFSPPPHFHVPSHSPSPATRLPSLADLSLRQMAVVQTVLLAHMSYYLSKQIPWSFFL